MTTAATEEDEVAVRVRLFAAARHAADATETTVDPGALPAILEQLEVRFGPRFGAVLAVATVLVDGSAVDRRAEVMVPDGAEVAILPPFSGGAGSGGR